MAKLAAAGLTVEVPPGWDAQIRPVEAPAPGSPAAASGAGLRTAGGRVPSVLHTSSFALPAERGDYGSGAVELMGGSDVLICLLEHEPEAATTALFRRVGVPPLRLDRFSPQSMQRAMPGMAGTQHFFQVEGRAFCLYVVIGSYRTGAPLVRQADAVVRSLAVTS